MNTKKYYAYNQTRECFLSGELTTVDAGLEPLKVLKILIEGLGPGVKTGLWLTHFRNVPVARTLSPFDLIYLDGASRVVHAVELSTDGEFAPFLGQPSSALILPAQSIASSKTRTGDQLLVQPVLVKAAEETTDQPAADSTHAPASPPPGSQIDPDPFAHLRERPFHASADPDPFAHLREVPFHVPDADDTVSPLEQFLARQSALAVAQGHVQPGSKSLLELSPAAHPQTLEAAPQSRAAGAEPQKNIRPWIRVIPSAVPRTGNPESPRIPRIAPSSGSLAEAAPSAERMAAPAQPIPARDPQPSRAKVEQFPNRGGAQRITSRAAEPPPDSLEAEEESEVPGREKISLLMRILRLQFLRRARASRRVAAIPRPKEVKPPESESKTVPRRVMRIVRWLYPEFVISTEPQAANQQSYSSKTQFRPEVKPTLDMQFWQWLYPEVRFQHPFQETAPSDRRRTSRLKKPGLVAYYFTGGPPRAHGLGDISVTGFYMHTEERWMPGTIIRMTLQLINSKGEDPADTITVHSRVVRWGPDGEGFEFVLAGFLDEPLPISYSKSSFPHPRANS